MLPDWQDIENRLYESSKAGILRFAAEHLEAICSFFAYSANPVYGEFLLCFDTPQNALEQAKQNEQQAIKRRSGMLSLEGAWRHATYFLTSEKVTEYSPDVGLFAYPDFVELKFEELDDLHFSEEDPQNQEYEDNYSNGNGQLVMWKVQESSSVWEFIPRLAVEEMGGASAASPAQPIPPKLPQTSDR